MRHDAVCVLAYSDFVLVFLPASMTDNPGGNKKGRP